jgi:hypothetical protein
VTDLLLLLLLVVSFAALFGLVWLCDEVQG